MGNGAQFVTIYGTYWMLLLFVNSWDSLELSVLSLTTVSVEEPSIALHSMMSFVTEVSYCLAAVDLLVGRHTTADT